MKLSILFLALFLFFATTTNAQFLPTANLTIFSESGDKFFLILNGERQNEVAQTNIRLEELPQPYYNCKIIFENPAMKEISKSVLMVVDANNVPQDVTYRIKKDKSGKAVLRFYSFSPAEQNMPRPSNCAVYRFNHPDEVIYGGGVQMGVESRNNTTTTRAGVSIGGVNLGVNVSVNESQSQSRNGGQQGEIISYDQPNNQNYSYQDNNNRQRNNNHRSDCNGMSNMNFQDAMKSIKESGFDETRLSTAQQIIESNCMTANQIVEVCKAMSFEETKLSFAKFAYAYCLDANNYFNVSKVFSFDASKQELNEYVRNQKSTR